MSIGLKLSPFIVCLFGGLMAWFGFGAKAEMTEDSIQKKIEKVFPQAEQMDLSTFRDLKLKNQVVVIDVRGQEEFELSHIEGAQNLISAESIKMIAESHPQQKVVLYCSVGYRSSDLAQRCSEMGLRNVFNLKGSIFAWANAGHEVYTLDSMGEKKKTKFVHPYNAKWGKLLNEAYHP
jgi:rhodanese-related sulfurtransferase